MGEVYATLIWMIIFSIVVLNFTYRGIIELAVLAASVPQDSIFDFEALWHETVLLISHMIKVIM
jgi:hypothetical protein